MGAYQHTKPNGHTIPGMNRVTVQWERVIVYQESCDSRQTPFCLGLAGIGIQPYGRGEVNGLCRELSVF